MIPFKQSSRIACALRASHITQRWSSSISPDLLARPIQSYISTSRDPYINLSIEHHLLQKSDPDSAVLFLYINRPSIIIGRNQNPWLEVNLSLLRSSRQQRDEAVSSKLGTVDLVRRRSGGGTVFHDGGNVNWTVISPSASFTRDKHAEMVVRGLRKCGVDRARVNERHDIVLDQGDKTFSVDSDDTHATPYQVLSDDGPRPLKVSGSAYKLTRNRALHHGTCLLSSPNLSIIPDYLHSPAKPFITARGVQSVSSPVGNISLSNHDFITAVQDEFALQYRRDIQPIELGDENIELDDVKKGWEEMKSKEWTFLQTPQFTLSTKAVRDLDIDFDLTVRYGSVTSGFIAARAPSKAGLDRVEFEKPFVGQRLHEIESWKSMLSNGFESLEMDGSKISAWLEKMIPRN